MAKKEHWSVKRFRKLRPAIGQYTNPMAQKMIEETADLEGSDLFLVETAIFYDPQPIGLAHLVKRGPYANPEAHKQRLQGALARGWLTKAGDGAYAPSEKGAQLYKQFAGAYKQNLAGVESIANDILESIQSVLTSVVKAARDTKEVMDKPALEMSLKETLGEDAVAIQRIELLTGNLLSYRDDAHVASWSPHQLNGITWESFSDIWGGRASSAAEIAEKRPYRGYSEKDYVSSLGELTSRGWIIERDDKKGKYNLTENGRHVREQAEDLTNKYYDVAWANLNAADEEKLKDLFQQLLDKHDPEIIPA